MGFSSGTTSTPSSIFSDFSIQEFIQSVLKVSCFLGYCPVFVLFFGVKIEKFRKKQDTFRTLFAILGADFGHFEAFFGQKAGQSRTLFFWIFGFFQRFLLLLY